jgi:hypothetical protein
VGLFDRLSDWACGVGKPGAAHEQLHRAVGDRDAAPQLAMHWRTT